LEHLSDCRAVGLKGAAIAGLTLIAGHGADAGLMRIEAGEERGPRGAAAGGVVELSEAEAAGGEGVEMRRADFAAVAAQLGVAEIVGQDQNHVGFFGGAERGRSCPHREQKGTEQQDDENSFDEEVRFVLWIRCLLARQRLGFTSSSQRTNKSRRFCTSAIAGDGQVTTFSRLIVREVEQPFLPLASLLPRDELEIGVANSAPRLFATGCRQKSVRGDIRFSPHGYVPRDQFHQY
jgi:hypothetical protein